MDSTYILLQHYWWFLVSLLGALLVFLLFVQGGFIKEVFHYLYSVEYAKSLGESEYEFFVKDRAHQILKTASESADSEIWKL